MKKRVKEAEKIGEEQGEGKINNNIFRERRLLMVRFHRKRI